MAKARQQYFADETSLQKDSREFAIADDVQQKIDSIEEGAQVNVIETVKVNGTALTPDANKAVDIDVPDVIDNLYTTSSDDALSANQGKLLYDYIQNLSSRGRFLSNWNAATGLPTTNPSENPYTYMAGDYYMVSNVASGGGTNYRPNGSSYTIGQASTTVETNIVDVSDIYLYDGTNWLLLTNSSRQIAVDSSLSTTSTNPVENRVITNELNKKYYGVVSNATPSNPTEGMLWYDTANDILKTYDGANWNEAGTQMVVLSYGNSTWNDFITAYADNAVVYCRASSNSNPATGTQGRMAFMAYVNNATNPTEVEFQYYRSRSDHNSAANQLDQVFIYKLTSASGGTWTVTERNTAAKAVAGTGINLAFGSGNMTISNTGVTSVNGDTGAVTVNDVKVSSTAPSSPTEGMVWYDTTNDQLKVYDGTNWQVTGKEYHAGKGIEIGTVQDYSAMQGPCPDGFHVPTEGEWSIMANSLISTFGRDPVQDLKMPLTGYRKNTNGTVNSQGNQGDYRSVTYEDEVGSMYYLEIGNNSADVYTGTPTYGRAIRPFKDEYVSPDNTWTIIQGALGNAGIFRNQSEGLISITDGSVGYTIADKNLGATQVYNYGDTLSEANCGKYYQRGNNYGFPRTGSVTTSSTLVDASNYGPGNYYSSSTFITNSVGWDSSNNANLRGGETGVVTINDAITNTGVLSVNGQTGDVTIDGGNTKTFYLSGTSGATALAEAQDAYDWYLAGKNPIVVYDGANYTYYQSSSSSIYFAGNKYSYSTTSSGTQTQYYYVRFTLSSGTVTGIYTGTYGMGGKYLTTDNTTPYTPTANYNPATKRYVDDSILQKRNFFVFDYDNITSSDVEAIWGILADNEKGIAFVTESSSLTTNPVPTMIYITSWNYSGSELYLYGFAFDDQDNSYVTGFTFIIDSSDYSITYDESIAWGLVGRTADSGKVLTGTGNGFGWEEPTFKVYNVDDVYNPSVSAGTLSNIVNKLKTEGKTAILYDAPNEYMYYPTELSIGNLSGSIYWTTIHDSSVTIVHRPVSRASITSNRTLGTVTESDKYLSPNPIQVVASLPATPDANTVYIVIS